MAAMTDKLTSNASALLGEPVVMAVRVKQGRGSPIANSFIRAGLAFVFTLPYLLVVLVKRLFGPLVASRRGPKPGILAFMPDGGYQLLGTSGSPSKPVIALRSFPSGTPLEVDHAHFEASLLVRITLDEFTCVINGTDLKALLRVVAAGNLSGTDLEQLARAYQRYSSSILASQEVGELRQQQGLAEKLSDPLQ